MLSRFSHQTTCTEVRLEGERRAELSQAQPEGVQGTCGTHRVAKQVHSEVRVIDPREAQALRAENTLLIWGPAHPCCTGSGMRELVTFHRHGAWAGGSKCELSGKAGQNQGRTEPPHARREAASSPQLTPPPPSLFLGSISWEEL